MIFPFELLSEVTESFSKDRLIGKGGFGQVYHGRLRHSDVAIKVLNDVCMPYSKGTVLSGYGYFSVVFNQ